MWFKIVASVFPRFFQVTFFFFKARLRDALGFFSDVRIWKNYFWHGKERWKVRSGWKVYFMKRSISSAFGRGFLARSKLWGERRRNEMGSSCNYGFMFVSSNWIINIFYYRQGVFGFLSLFVLLFSCEWMCADFIQILVILTGLRVFRIEPGIEINCRPFRTLLISRDINDGHICALQKRDSTVFLKFELSWAKIRFFFNRFHLKIIGYTFIPSI